MSSGSNDNQFRPLRVGWLWAKLGEVCDINPRRPRGFSRAPDALTDFVPMVAVDEINGVIARKEQRPYQEVANGYTYFAEGDVLFAKITPCMQNGKSAIAHDLTEGIGFGTTEFHVLRPGNEVTADWIWMFVRQPSFRKAAARRFEGSAGQQRVPESFLSNSLIPLAPLPEQTLIAERLRDEISEVARMRRAAQRQRDVAGDMRKAVLQSAFEGDGVSRWPLRPLRQIIREPLKNGLSPRADPQGNYRCLTLSAVRDGVILSEVAKPVRLSDDRARPHLLADSDIYLIRGNGTKSLVGAAGRCDSDDATTIYPDTLIRARLNPEFVQSDYFLFVWNSARTRSQVEAIARTAAGIWKVNQEKLSEIVIPVPPFPEQAEIVQRLRRQLEDGARVLAAASRQLEAINALPGALLREVFGGFAPPPSLHDSQCRSDE